MRVLKFETNTIREYEIEMVEYPVNTKAVIILRLNGCNVFTLNKNGTFEVNHEELYYQGFDDKE